MPTDASDQFVDFIGDSIGHFGYYQMMLALLSTCNRISASMHKYAVVYLTTPVNMTCAELNPPGYFFKKNPFLNKDVCSNKNCKYVYDKRIFDSTIITEWDLVCDRYYIADLAHTLHMAGNMIGNILFGIIADKCGRYKSVIASAGITSVFAISTGLTHNLYLFLICRFICGFGVAGLITGYTLLIESISNKYRFKISLFYQLGYAIGICLLTFFAYFIRNWQYWYISFSAPFAVITIVYVFCLYESPRWLLLQGKVEECIAVLERVAVANRKPKEHISEIINNLERTKKDSTDTTIFHLFQKTLIKKTTILCFMNIACSMSAVGNFTFRRPMNSEIFFFQALLALALIPGTFIACVLRKMMTIKYIAIVSLSSIIISLIMRICLSSYDQGQFICAMIFSFFQTILQSSIMLLVAQVYPTALRSQAQGIIQASANIGSMLAPFPLRLQAYHAFAPIILYILILTSVVTSLFFISNDEDTELPDTISDIRTFKERCCIRKNTNAAENESGS